MEKETVFTERYMIREAAKQVGVETHVLRYWEKELSLEIPKNEMRHRYYTNTEITLLKQIKYLKEQGFHLKSIRLLKEHISEISQMDIAKLHSLRDRLNSQLMVESTVDTEDTSHSCDDENNKKDSKSLDSKSSDIFAESPVGEPVGMPTGEVIGKKVKMADLAEKNLTSETAKIQPERKETQLLELELAEPQKPKESMGQKVFDVVQGGRAVSDKGFTVFFKNASLAVTGKESPEKENFITVNKKDTKKNDRKEVEERNLKEDKKKTLSITNKEVSTKDNFIGQAGSQEIDNRMEQFRMIMGDIIGEALRENNKDLAKDVSSHVSDKVIKEMDFMMRSQQEEEEERYRKLDETIRSYQKSHQEIAAGREETVGKRKRGLFLKKKKERWE